MSIMEKERKMISGAMGSSSFKDTVEKTAIGVAKDNKKSEICRKQANLIFNNQLHDSSSHEEIWKLYSKSVALAELRTEELALAYANRSAILLHMSKYEDSLMDIGRALDITKNNCLRIKLFIREAKCLHALGSVHAERVLNEALSLLEMIKVEDLKKIFVNDIIETKFMLKKPFEHVETYTRHPELFKTLNKRYRVNDFSSIKMKFDRKNGRHLIAARDIIPGEIIYMEQPFVHCVNSENAHSYCYHCLNTISTWANIPCDDCAWAMFCSELCKKEAWEQYHRIECSLNRNRQNLDDDCVQLAVKTLCLALKEFGGVENLKAELAKFDKMKDDGYKGFIINDEIYTSGFKTMYMLSSNVTKFKMQKHKENAAWFLDTLAKTTELLQADLHAKSTSTHMKNENAIFLGALFLRLSTVSEINKLEMWNGSFKCPKGSILKLNCCKSSCCSKGVYIAPVTSLINHSCNPNVNICYSDEHEAIIYALRPIKKGEQVLRCYLDEFFLMEKSMRRRLLNNMYNFQCNCEACDNNWPSLWLKQNVAADASSSVLSVTLPSEVELDSHLKRMQSTCTGSASYNGRKMIAYVSRDLEKAFKKSSQPTTTTVHLMKTLSIIFNHLYGIALFVPSECNSEIKFV